MNKLVEKIILAMERCCLTHAAKTKKQVGKIDSLKYFSVFLISLMDNLGYFKLVDAPGLRVWKVTS